MRVMTKKLHLYVIWIMFIQARYKEKRPSEKGRDGDYQTCSTTRFNLSKITCLNGVRGKKGIYNTYLIGGVMNTYELKYDIDEEWHLSRNLLDVLNQEIERLGEEARRITDGYIAWWSEENRSVLELKKQKQSVKTSRLAPFVRHHHQVNKLYIYWAKWPIKEVRGSRFVKTIPLGRDGYTESKLRAYCVGWELDAVLKTEQALKSIRKKINAYRSVVMMINKESKISQRNEQAIE